MLLLSCVHRKTKKETPKEAVVVTQYSEEEEAARGTSQAGDRSGVGE